MPKVKVLDSVLIPQGGRNESKRFAPPDEVEVSDELAKTLEGKGLAEPVKAKPTRK